MFHFTQQPLIPLPSFAVKMFHCGRLLIYIKWTKTIQFHQRLLAFPLLPIPGNILCPVSAYKNMLALVPADPAHPAFSVMSGSSVILLTYRRFLSKLKLLASKAGHDPSVILTHSLRRGGASLAFRTNVPAELIRIQGDWASEAYLRYLNVPLSQRVQVASLLKAYIESA